MAFLTAKKEPQKLVFRRDDGIPFIVKVVGRKVEIYIGDAPKPTKFELFKKFKFRIAVDGIGGFYKSKSLALSIRVGGKVEREIVLI